MHVAVLLRMVPDTKEDLEVDEGGRDIDRQWIGFKLCEFDDQALEEAVLLKERGGAKVTAMALAGDGADRMLQTAAARGADFLVKVNHDIDDTRNSAQVAAAFAVAVRQVSADVVLTGVMSPDDILGQLAGTLGGLLGVPAYSAVTQAVVAGNGLQVRQEYSGGRSALLDVAVPAVVGVQSASQPPRYVAGSKLRQAAGTVITTVEVGASAASTTTEITALSAPTRSSSAVMLDGDAAQVAAQIVDALVAKSLVGG